MLEGPTSTILERDILLFSIKSMSPGIQVLPLRSSKVRPGETVYIVGNPYSSNKSVRIATKVVRQLGLDILIEQGNDELPGFSGSPVVDSNGHVVGVFSSSWGDPVTGKNVIVATSIEYAKNVLDGKKDVNKPKEDYGKLLLDEIVKKGSKSGIRLYNKLIKEPSNYYKYNLRSASGNGLLEAGEKLLEMNKVQDAIDILEFNVKVNSGYFHNYNVLAKAYWQAGNKSKAIETFRISIQKLNDKEENGAFKELEQLGVKDN
jgi:S1-C subfamily serine protease